MTFKFNAVSLGRLSVGQIGSSCVAYLRVFAAQKVGPQKKWGEIGLSHNFIPNLK